MGCYGDPLYYPTHEYEIANGIDRGNGYQGYTSVTYFLKNKDGFFPKEALNNLKSFLRAKGYSKYLKELKTDPVRGH